MSATLGCSDNDPRELAKLFQIGRYSPWLDTPDPLRIKLNVAAFSGAYTTYPERAFAPVRVPVLANMTEFGKTPMFTLKQFRSAGIRLVLYPLSAFRAMNAAAEIVYQTIRRKGTQRSVLGRMQTRKELYRLLDYQQAEKHADRRIRRRR